MTTYNEPPPRKGCTAFETELGTDDDPLFVVLTLHHGLGDMTRVDLSADDATQLAAALLEEAEHARSFT